MYSFNSENPSPVFEDDVWSAETYKKLIRMAQRLMQNERSNHTWQATAVVHELWIRLHRERDKVWTPRTLMAAARHGIKQLLVEHVRSRNAKKRSGTYHHVSLEDAVAAVPSIETSPDLISALSRLKGFDQESYEAVTLHYGEGKTIAETAAELNVSVKHAEKTITFARCWLRREMTAKRS
jgi:RNA polymerase sigma factor (TIGR02999 family)